MTANTPDSYQICEYIKVLQRQHANTAIIKEVVLKCQSMMGAKASSIFLIETRISGNSEEKVLQLKDFIGYDKLKRADIPLVFYILHKYNNNDNLGLTAQIAIDGKIIRINNRAEFKTTKEYAGKFDSLLWNKPDTCQSFAGMPIIYDEECLGVLKVESDQIEFFGEDHILHLEILTHILATAIHSYNLRNDLGDAMQLLAVSQYDQEILQKIVNECKKLCHAETCSLFLFDKKEIGLILRADAGHPNNLSHKKGNDSNPRGFIYDGKTDPAGLTWSCYESEKEIDENHMINSDIHANKLWDSQWGEDNHPCHSIYLYPIPKKGVLKVENKLDILDKPKEGRRFSKQDRFVIKLFADAIGQLLREDITFSSTHTADEIYGKSILEILASDDILDEFEKKYGFREIGEILHNFSTLKNMAGSKIGTLEEYTKEVLHIVKEISQIIGFETLTNLLLSKLRHFEEILIHLPEYRHHFIHQFNVFLLGLVIMINDNSFTKIVRNKTEKHCFIKEWFLISIFHDIGLPIEKLQDAFRMFIKESMHLENPVKQHLTSFSIIDIYDYFIIYPQIENCVKYVFGEDISKEVLRVIHQFAHPIPGDITNHNHSLISACIIAKHLDANAECLYLRPRVLSSILLHEPKLINSIYYKRMAELRRKNTSKTDPELNQLIDRRNKISLNDQPMCFLLSLCDTIQNWARPESSESLSYLDRDLKISLQSLSFNDKVFTVTLDYSKTPHNWDYIFDEIIVPQTEMWPFDCNGYTIRIEFKSGDVFLHGKSGVRKGLAVYEPLPD